MGRFYLTRVTCPSHVFTFCISFNDESVVRKWVSLFQHHTFYKQHSAEASFWPKMSRILYILAVLQLAYMRESQNFVEVCFHVLHVTGVVSRCEIQIYRCYKMGIFQLWEVVSFTNTLNEICSTPSLIPSCVMEISTDKTDNSLCVFKPLQGGLYTQFHIIHIGCQHLLQYIALEVSFIVFPIPSLTIIHSSDINIYSLRETLMED